MLDAILQPLSHAVAERVDGVIRAATRRERPLRAGVDIRPFYEPLTGIGWYLHFLLRELAKRDDVELVLIGDARITDEGPKLHVAPPPNAKLLAFDLRGIRPSRFDRPLTAAGYLILMKLSGCDVIFGANYF